MGAETSLPQEVIRACPSVTKNPQSADDGYGDPVALSHPSSVACARHGLISCVLCEPTPFADNDMRSTVDALRPVSISRTRSAENKTSPSPVPDSLLPVGLPSADRTGPGEVTDTDTSEGHLQTSNSKVSSLHQNSQPTHQMSSMDHMQIGVSGGVVGEEGGQGVTQGTDSNYCVSHGLFHCLLCQLRSNSSSASSGMALSRPVLLPLSGGPRRDQPESIPSAITSSTRHPPTNRLPSPHTEISAPLTAIRMKDFPQLGTVVSGSMSMPMSMSNSQFLNTMNTTMAQFKSTLSHSHESIRRRLLCRTRVHPPTCLARPAP